MPVPQPPKEEPIERKVDVDEEGSVVSEPAHVKAWAEGTHIESVTTPHVCEDIFCDMKTVEQDAPTTNKEDVRSTMKKPTTTRSAGS